MSAPQALLALHAGRAAALLVLLAVVVLIGFWCVRILASMLRREGPRLDPWVPVFEGDQDRAGAVAGRLGRSGVAGRVEADPGTPGIFRVRVLRRDARRALEIVAGEGGGSP